MRRRAVVRWRLALVVGALLLGGSAAEATVHAGLDRTEVPAGETVELNLEHDGQTDELPDLGALRQDFDIVSSSRSSRVQIINGAVSASTELALTLAPKRSGVLTVPAIVWGTDRSLPLRLTVEGAGAAGASRADRDVFLEIHAEPTQPYVQAAVDLTVRLYAAVPLHRASLDLPASSDLLVQQIGADSSSTAERNGRHYQVIERHYLLFPQHSGTIDVPGVQLEAQVATGARDTPLDNQVFADIWSRFPFGGLWGRVKTLRLRGDPLALEVRPRPAAAFAQYWLPARALTLRAEWHPDRLETRVGDPLTLSLHLEAVGLTAAQLPDLAALLELPAGLKAYPDQPRLSNGSRDGTVVGEREQNVALIAEAPGHYTLPELRVHWWDTRDNQPREATLAAVGLDVLPGAAAAVPPAPAAAAAPVRRARPAAPGAWDVATRPWIALAAGFALLWLLTLLGWWTATRRRRGDARVRAPPPAPDGTAVPTRAAVRAAWRRVREACERDAPAEARRALLDWAAVRWPLRRTSGLRALGERLGLVELPPLLRDLERACYAGGEWRGAPLLRALAGAGEPAAPPSPPRATLRPLYED